jgi:HAMP domain-containing protein
VVARGSSPRSWISPAWWGRSALVEARSGIASVTTNIILLWLGAIAVGFVLTYLLARRIVEPVEQLDRAAAEVARQNYEIEVPVQSEDEIGRLARTFNTMCASIRQAREDLIRQERISTIGRLSGSIVHDLRNPLAAIYGGAEMLVDADRRPTKRLAHIYRRAVFRKCCRTFSTCRAPSRDLRRPAGCARWPQLHATCWRRPPNISALPCRWRFQPRSKCPWREAAWSASSPT